jgi:hypothetical protein
MYPIRKIVTVVVLALFALGCQSGPSIGHPQAIAVSRSPEPEWLHTLEPVGQNGFMFFVGRSVGTATEQTAVANSRQDVVDQVLEYLGGFAQREFEQRAVSVGLESAVLDPTTASRQFRDFAYQEYVRQNPPQDVYWEYRRTPGGDAYFAYVLQAVPVAQAMDRFAETKVEEAQERVRQAQDARARQQAEDYMEFWTETQGAFEEE